MGHPLLAFPDSGDLISERVAAAGEVGRYVRGRLGAQVEHRTRPGEVQSRRVVGSDGTGRVGRIGPVAVCVEVLRSVQDPAESFEGLALCPGVRGLTRGGLPESAFRVEGNLVRDDLALGVEKRWCAVRPLPEATTQLVDA